MQHRSEETENKILKALKKKLAENANPITFEKILLKFEKMREVLGFVKSVFQKVAKDGIVDNAGFQSTMTQLDAQMSVTEIQELLEFVDLDSNQMLSIKEFFVALTIGVALDAIPSLCKKSTPGPVTFMDESGEVGPPTIRRQFSALDGHEAEIEKTLHLVVDAYLLFDTEARGFIDRKNVESLLSEHDEKGHTSHIMNKERWGEMDWNSDGTIDFAEFVYAFTSWIDIDED